MFHKKILFLVALFFIQGVSVAQNASEIVRKYENGKNLFEQKKYALAKEQLRQVMSQGNNPYEEYASFFYALAAYEDGDKSIAKNTLLKLQLQNEAWKNKYELVSWLIKMYLDEDNFQEAYRQYGKLSSDDQLKATPAITNYLDSMDLDELTILQSRYPTEKVIGESLAQQINRLPAFEQDQSLLDSLIMKFALDESKFGSTYVSPSMKKSNYQVAILFPFYFDQLQSHPEKVSNEFVLELYRGIIIAAKKLEKQGKNVSVFVYDTKRSEEATKEILRRDELKHMDLIIGPLYPEPVKLVSDFCFTYHVNMINPISSNSDIVYNNPYAFLLMPTNEDMGIAAANSLRDSVMNRNAMIFYGNNTKDSTLAFSYKKVAEENGFKIIKAYAINSKESRKIIDILTNSFKLKGSLEYAEQWVLDSIAVEKSIYPKATLRVSEEDYLVIQPDSIGHIFLASDNASIAASTITALETRGDNIKLIGKDTWIFSESISLEGIDKLDVHLISPNFLSYSQDKYLAFRKNYELAFNALPSLPRYAVYGHDALMVMGQLMHQYGNHFQQKITPNDVIYNTVLPSYSFYKSQSNTNITFSTFKDQEWIKLPSKY